MVLSFMQSLVGGPSPSVKGIVWGQFFSSIPMHHPISLRGSFPLMRQISKFNFPAFWQCPKRLWLEKNSEVTDEASQVGRLD